MSREPELRGFESIDRPATATASRCTSDELRTVEVKTPIDRSRQAGRRSQEVAEITEMLFAVTGLCRSDCYLSRKDIGG